MTQIPTAEPGSTPLPLRQTPEAACVLHIEQLGFGYPGQPLFSQLSAAIPPGVTLIKGGDGRGKTSLLRLLAGELQPASGDMQIHGLSLAKQPDAYRQQVFRCDTQTDAFDALTLGEYFGLQRSRWSAFNDQALADAIEGLGLAEHLHKNIFMLSTGSKRKVWLAAAFAADAAVTLLDEPFSALDAPSIRFVLARLQDAGDLTHIAQNRQRAWLVADYEAPAGLMLASVIDLGD